MASTDKELSKLFSSPMKRVLVEKPRKRSLCQRIKQYFCFRALRQRKRRVPNEVIEIIEPIMVALTGSDANGFLSVGIKLKDAAASVVSPKPAIRRSYSLVSVYSFESIPCQLLTETQDSNRFPDEIFQSNRKISASSESRLKLLATYCEILEQISDFLDDMELAPFGTQTDSQEDCSDTLFCVPENSICSSYPSSFTNVDDSSEDELHFVAFNSADWE